MTDYCDILPSGNSILTNSPNCEHATFGAANYEFIIDSLDINRDLNQSWFCHFTRDLYLNITFVNGKTLIFIVQTRYEVFVCK